jgi:hypothetical protein
MPPGVNRGVDSAAQYDYDTLSWQQFVAINWPAAQGSRGNPDTTRSIGDEGARVWESWKDVQEVFLPEGARPAPWDSMPPMVVCDLRAMLESSAPGAPSDRSALKMLAPPSQISVELNQASTGVGKFTGPLVDQNGLYVRYEVRMNRAEFDYFYTTGYYDSLKQVADIDAGTFQNPPGKVAGQPTSTEIKAAWRVLITNPAPGQRKDDPSRYFWRWALLYDPVTRQCTGPVQVGLIGLHILRLVPGAGMWVWSTFEQVDNVSLGAGASSDLRPSLNPSATMTPYPPNGFSRQLAPVTGHVTEPVPDSVVNVSRVYAIGDPATNDPYVAAINTYYQSLLPAPWKYYQLMGTQNPRPGKKGDGPPVNRKLSNVTMETYKQVGTDCFSCHNSAHPAKGSENVFTFALQMAHASHPVASR